MSLTETRKGELLTVLYSSLEALWPIISIVAAGSVHPFIFTALSTLIAAPIFFGLMIARGRLPELKRKEAWLPLLALTVILVAILHPLMSLAMTHTVAGNASIVMLVEVLYSFIFFGFVLRVERYSMHAFIGAGMMLVGAAAILFHGTFTPRIGDIALFFVMALAPIGNFFQQRARQIVSTETLLFVRSFFGGTLAFIMGYAFFPHPTMANIAHIWPYLAVNALLIFCFQKIVWVEAIARIPVAKALSLRAITPAFTFVLAFFMLREVPSWWQIAGFLPMAAGAYLILNKDFLHPAAAPEPIR